MFCCVLRASSACLVLTGEQQASLGVQDPRPPRGKAGADRGPVLQIVTYIVAAISMTVMQIISISPCVCIVSFSVQCQHQESWQGAPCFNRGQNHACNPSQKPCIQNQNL